MEGGVNEGRSISNCTPGTNGIVPGTSELVRTLIPVTAGEPDKVALSQRNAHDLDEPRRTTSCRNYSTEGGVAEDRSALDGRARSAMALRPGDDGSGKGQRVVHGKATNGGRDAAATVKFSKRAAGCLGGTVREGEGMLSSAMQVSWQRTLDPLRPAAACAEAVAMKVRNLVLSKKGGICCYSTQCGSGKHPPSPASEEAPANSPSFSVYLSPDTELGFPATPRGALTRG